MLKSNSSNEQHTTLLQWWLGAGVLLFLLYAAWRAGLLSLLLNGDPSRLSLVILVAFVLANAHAILSILNLSKERNATLDMRNAFVVAESLGKSIFTDSTIDVSGKSLIGRHIENLQRRLRGNMPGNSDPQAMLLNAMERRLRTGVKFGWLFADLMIKLGLLGTVIGFILMLGSVVSLEHYDLSTMQDLMRTMGDGMRVALFTTLAGLICGLLLGMQYQFIDRHTDLLLAEIQELSEVFVIPALCIAGEGEA